jgi:CelD/BcsL family acetyltransferase involved in cellulose biosynthesis
LPAISSPRTDSLSREFTIARQHGELVTTVGDVMALADEWRPLAETRGNAFITPEWFLAWLRHYGEGWRPHVTIVRSADGALRGVVPLIASASGRRIALRTCRGDRFQPACGVGQENAIATAASRALSAHQTPRTLVLENVDKDATWWTSLARGPHGLVPVGRPEIELPFIELGGIDWNEYLAGRSRQLRSQLGRKMRSLRRDHGVRLRRTERAEDVHADLDALFGLHAARWAQRRERSNLAGSAVRSFHDEFARAAFDRGWLRLYRLEVDGSAIAALYGWLIGRRWTYLQAGFDPAWSRYSPGFLLIAETIREAIDEGAVEYDLLLGDEAYKYRFATGSRRGRTVILVGRTDPLRVAVAARARLRGAWRRLPPRSRANVKRLAGRVGILR